MNKKKKKNFPWWPHIHTYTTICMKNVFSSEFYKDQELLSYLGYLVCYPHLECYNHIIHNPWCDLHLCIAKPLESNSIWSSSLQYYLISVCVWWVCWKVHSLCKKSLPKIILISGQILGSGSGWKIFNISLCVYTCVFVYTCNMFIIPLIWR